MRGRTKDRGNESHHDRRIQSKARVDPCDERVSHGLGQRDGGDGHAGEQIVARFLPGVVELHSDLPNLSNENTYPLASDGLLAYRIAWEKCQGEGTDQILAVIMQLSRLCLCRIVN